MHRSLVLGLLLAAAPAPAVHGSPSPLAVHRQESAAEWIAAGHALRAEGRWAEALRAYEKASALNGGALDSRTWELRCWMELGRINDALDAIDALDTAGAPASTLDYLFGMAFVRKAEINVAAGVTDSSVAMNFGDAVELLSRATEAEPERFADALPHLAQAAYNSQRNELARETAEKALARFPDEPKHHLLLGRIALSQFVVARGDGTADAEAESHWATSEAAFRSGIDVLGAPTEPVDQTLLARLWTQLGYAYGWKPERAAQAAEAFQHAIEWDPATVDYSQIWTLVGIDEFIRISEAATQAFVERAGEEDARVATPLWFLGHAYFQKERWAEAEDAFTRSVETWPAYSAAWFYIGRARYGQGDSKGAIEAFREHWRTSPEEMVQTMQSDTELNVAILDWLVGQAVQDGSNLDAAFLAEVLAETVPTEPRYWNNLGLFLRDEGERMLREAPDENVDVRAELFERAYAAYERALALRPDDPALLNDTALMLHYHLKRELDRAAEMYRHAYARASEELSREDLPEDLRALYEIAKRDAGNNLKLLEEELAGS